MTETEKPFQIGDLVHDQDETRPNDMIVANLPGVPANEWDVPPIQKTVAEDNPDYPADAQTVVVVYRTELQRSNIDWDPTCDAGDPLPLSRINGSAIAPYSFPAPRLTLIEEADVPDESEDTADESSSASPVSGGSAASETTTDDTEDSAESSTETDESPPQSDAPPEPSPALVNLKSHLDSFELAVEVADDKEAVVVSKLGQEYQVRPNGEVEGEGAFRSRIETVVANMDDD